MNKRRRAYKKYDWREHKQKLLFARVLNIYQEEMCRAIDVAIIHGSESQAFSEAAKLARANIVKRIDDLFARKELR